MNKRILTTAVVALLIAITMIGLRHIDVLNDGIKLKQIEIKDNSSQLRLLDSKYQKLNDDLLKKDADKVELEKRLQDLQKEREKLQADLQAKREQKAKDIAVVAQQAFTAPVRTQTAYAASGNADKDYIYMRESGNRTTAINEIGCRGLGQACPGTKLPCGDDYACQDAWFTQYAMQRYGSWSNARAFWDKNRWW